MTETQLKSVADQREKPRIPLIVTATISVPSEGLVLPCIVTDLSAGGAGLQYEQSAPPPNLRGQLEIARFGFFLGTMVRAAGQNRGFRFLDGEAERQHLTENLIAYVSRGITNVDVERRKYPRCAGNNDLLLTLPSGATESCQVLDISLEGVSLGTKSRPPIGHLLRVGHLYGRVTSHREDGIGMKFVSFVGL